MKQLGIDGLSPSLQALAQKRGKGLNKGQCRISGCLWPDGQFSVGFSHYRGETRNWVDLDEHGNPIDLIEEGCSVAEMGSSSPLNSHNTERGRSPRGLKGITRYGRLMVSSGCWMFNHVQKMGCMAMLTCTVPAMERAQEIELSERWDEVVRQFNQELRRLLKRKGLSGLLVGVTEIQSKRLQEYGSPGLHYHVVFQNKKFSPRAGWGVSVVEARELWKRVLQGVLGFEIADTFAAATRIERVEKSVGGYLSKYLSKGSEVLDLYLSLGYKCPSAWWSMSSELKKLIQKYCVRSEELGKELWDKVRGGDFAVVRAKEMYWNPEGEPPVLVGYVGMCDAAFIRSAARKREGLMVQVKEIHAP